MIDLELSWRAAAVTAACLAAASVAARHAARTPGPQPAPAGQAASPGQATRADQAAALDLLEQMRRLILGAKKPFRADVFVSDQLRHSNDATTPTEP